MTQSTPPAVTEQDARAVAEAARETEWRPSFAKELYLGRFRLDLVHPHPRRRRTTSSAARRSWPAGAIVTDECDRA